MSEAIGVFTIPAGEPFLATLGRGLLHEAGDDPLALAAVTVLLPTRRACRALAETLLRLADGRAMLLPRMRPLGDVDEDELAFDSGFGSDELALHPAVPELRRRLLLAELVRVPRPDLDAAQAAQLAEELTRLLDALQREDLALADLEDITPESFAAHWQETLKFLQVLAEPWQTLLEAERAMDPVARRGLLLRRLAERWRLNPPSERIVAAGSTGSIPATAELLATVATLPRGAVVLPGLDQTLDEAAWEALAPSHPQYGLRQLIAGLGVARAEVATWPAAADAPPPPRVRLLSEALRPAATTERWRDLADGESLRLDGLWRIDCAGPKEEAATIAVLMRQTLETPEATAALVTPDRTLARRVAVELARWGVQVDDSAGVPLETTSPGTFLRLVATALATELTPVPLLSMLKHPLSRGGRPAAEFKTQVRHLERRVLRGPRPAPGFRGLAGAVQEADGHRRLQQFVEALAAAGEEFARLAGSAETALGTLVDAHIAFAEWLSRDEAGQVLLWHGEAGEAAARFVYELHAAAAGLRSIAPAHYPELLRHLMAGQAVRPRFGRHPRLHIWGPLEARLQQADLVILGGLNEGTWPAEALVDPWLSRPMRLRVGLPAPERRIGLAAHDFCEGASAPRAVLTRAARVEGTPTVPSRWLLRLDGVLNAAGLAWPDQWPADLKAWQAALDDPGGYRPVGAPTIAPPLAARPRQLSVTQVETWMRDPYSIYARHILRLEALEPIDADPGAAERGTVVHEALEAFVAAYPERLPEDAYERLLECGRRAFGAMLHRPGVAAFWWPRFEAVARWFLEVEAGRRPEARPLATEVRGELTVATAGGPFRLTAHADRIDRLADGSLALIDYKTGAPPSDRLIRLGYAAQLPLEAAIARAGGFEGIGPAEVGELAHWRLSGGRVAGEIKRLKLDPAEAAEQALQGLERLIARFDDPATPYLARPRPEMAPRFSDYEHLARIKEWASGLDGDEA